MTWRGRGGCGTPARDSPKSWDATNPDDVTQRNTAAIVLAAGLGARMNSAMPKVLHPLAGRPMIAWLMDSLAEIALDRRVGK